MLFGNWFFVSSGKCPLHTFDSFVDGFVHVSLGVDYFQDFAGYMYGQFAVIIMVFAAVIFFGKKPNLDIGNFWMVSKELLGFLASVFLEFWVVFGMKSGYRNVHWVFRFLGCLDTWIISING